MLVVGTITAAVALGAAFVAGRSVARRVLPPDDEPGSTGLATVVVGLTLVLTTAKALGAVGQLRPWPTFAAIVAVSIAAAAASRGGGGSTPRSRSSSCAGSRSPAMRWRAA